uniref:Uncharacterized protein n=1 Tax=Rhizophora mucronata TaxID=61149 RepID=A0A2P2PHB7_RHIMU
MNIMCRLVGKSIIHAKVVPNSSHYFILYKIPLFGCRENEGN